MAKTVQNLSMLTNWVFLGINRMCMMVAWTCDNDENNTRAHVGYEMIDSLDYLISNKREEK